MKQCTKCKEDKPLKEFHKAKGYDKGVSSKCKLCKKEYDVQRYVQKKEKIKRQRLQRYYQNQDKEKEKLREYAKNNLKGFRRRNAKRRASKMERHVFWADNQKIKQIYDNCPPGLVVDHIVPLQGDIVSGLHVHYNLQYLTKAENSAKGNKWPYPEKRN